MATHIFSAGALFVGATDYSGLTKQFGVDANVDAVDVTTLGMGTRSFAGGLKANSFAADLLYDGSFDTQLFNAASALSNATLAQLVTYFPDGALAENERAYFLRSLTAKFSLPWTLGNAAMITLAGMSSELSAGIASQELAFGYLSSRGVAVAAGANGTGRQLGVLASTKQFMAMGAHVTARTGTAVVTFILESDDNTGFTTPITRATSAALSAPGEAWVAPVQGPIATDDWWRVRYTITGTGTVSFRASMGRIVQP